MRFQAGRLAIAHVCLLAFLGFAVYAVRSTDGPRSVESAINVRAWMIALWWIATMFVTLSAVWQQRSDESISFREKVENIVFASSPAAFGPVLVVTSYTDGPIGYAFWLPVTIVSFLACLVGAAVVASIFTMLARQGLFIFSMFGVLATAILGYLVVGGLLVVGYCC